MQPILVRRTSQSGFTLAEMAIVLFIVGITLSMGLKMVTSNLDNAAINETKAKQDLLKTALISFLRTNGRLPCPDIAAIPTGVEAAVCNTAPTNLLGAVPWRTLNVPKDAAQDGWKNFFGYKIANGQTAVPIKDWSVKTAGANTFSVTQLSAPSNGLTIQEGDGVTALTQVTNQAVVAIVSFGKNGFGARTVLGQLNTTPPAANTNELTNAANVAGVGNAVTFIRRPYTENATSLGGPFDDIVAYMTPADLLQPLVNEKTINAITASAYKTMALQALFSTFTSCAPPASATPAVTAALTPVQPTVGFGAITYSCIGAGAFCNPPTAIHATAAPITAPNQPLFQLSVFGAAATNVLYSELQAAVPNITAVCP